MNLRRFVPGPKGLWTASRRHERRSSLSEFGRGAGLLACSFLVLLFAPLAIPAPALAGHGPGGFAIGFGAGYGIFDQESCPRCDSDGGPSGWLDVGTSIAPGTRLSLLTTVWTKHVNEGTRAATGNATATITYFPPGAGGLYGRLGAGVAGYSIDGGFEAGPGFTAGAGYEFPLAPAFGAGMFLNWFHGDFEDFNAHVLQFGVAVTAG